MLHYGVYLIQWWLRVVKSLPYDCVWDVLVEWKIWQLLEWNTIPSTNYSEHIDDQV